MDEKEKEKILNALQVIQDTCLKTSCDTCPFYSPVADCIIHNSFPDEWRLANKEKTIWRAFNY